MVPVVGGADLEQAPAVRLHEHAGVPDAVRRQIATQGKDVSAGAAEGESFEGGVVLRPVAVAPDQHARGTHGGFDPARDGFHLCGIQLRGDQLPLSAPFQAGPVEQSGQVDPSRSFDPGAPVRGVDPFRDVFLGDPVTQEIGLSGIRLAGGP